MRSLIAVVASAVLLPSVAPAQQVSPSASAPEIVHRLSEAETEAIIKRQTEARLTREKFTPSDPARLSRAGRIGAGILGFLGRSAAESAYDRQCININNSCGYDFGNFAHGDDVLRH